MLTILTLTSIFEKKQKGKKITITANCLYDDMMLQIKWDYCNNLKILPQNPTLVSDEMLKRQLTLPS